MHHYLCCCWLCAEKKREDQRKAEDIAEPCTKWNQGKLPGKRKKVYIIHTNCESKEGGQLKLLFVVYYCRLISALCLKRLCSMWSSCSFKLRWELLQFSSVPFWKLHVNVLLNHCWFLWITLCSYWALMKCGCMLRLHTMGWTLESIWTSLSTDRQLLTILKLQKLPQIILRI